MPLLKYCLILLSIEAIGYDVVDLIFHHLFHFSLMFFSVFVVLVLQLSEIRLNKCVEKLNKIEISFKLSLRMVVNNGNLSNEQMLSFYSNKMNARQKKN